MHGQRCGRELRGRASRGMVAAGYPDPHGIICRYHPKGRDVASKPIIAALFACCGLLAGDAVAPLGSYTSVERRHWAFQKRAHPEIPGPEPVAWVKNPVDAFILARLRKEGLQPAP